MQQNGPWRIKSSEVKYQNPWIHVREDKVIRPDGKDGIFGVVEMTSGVSVLPIDEDGTVYLTEEYRYGIKQRSVEAASGGIEKGETPLEAAKRELEEEVGVRAEEWIEMGLINPFTSIVVSPQTLYVAKKLTWTATNPEGTEQIRVIKTTFDEALQMVKDGKITHAATCLIILRAADLMTTKS